jgi:hypothetical protein
MKKNSQAFVNQIVVCLLVTICFGGTVGLGTVWMRHQISTTANTNRQLAAELTELRRLISERTAVIESEQHPELLRGLNTRMRLGLVPMNDVPLYNVTEDPVRRMVERANAGVFSDGPPPLTLKLAQH